MLGKPKFLLQGEVSCMLPFISTRLVNSTGKTAGDKTMLISQMEKEMAPHSSTLAWRTPGTGEPGGLPFMGLHRVGCD